MTTEKAIEFGKIFIKTIESEKGSATYDFVETAIKALEQQSTLDKIRAEIDVARFIDKDTKLCKNANASGLEVAMQIIDKYKAESEERNDRR